MSCAAWDLGAIGTAMRQVLGFAVEPKTTKTKCGRRRALSRIDNDDPTCKACREIIEGERAKAYELQAALASGDIESRRPRS